MKVGDLVMQARDTFADRAVDSQKMLIIEIIPANDAGNIHEEKVVTLLNGVRRIWSYRDLEIAKH